jgi:hypothetical protein
VAISVSSKINSHQQTYGIAFIKTEIDCGNTLVVMPQPAEKAPIAENEEVLGLGKAGYTVWLSYAVGG